eukprot:3676248-Rhodomonas_salina.1
MQSESLSSSMTFVQCACANTQMCQNVSESAQECKKKQRCACAKIQGVRMCEKVHNKASKC